MSLGGFAARAFAGKWIAGAHISDAIRGSKELNEKGLYAIINYLGEEYENAEYIENAVSTYLGLIKKIKHDRIKADISVKPTQIGLLLGKKIFRRNYKKIVESAKLNGVFVWFDMEERWSVTETINTYKDFVKYGNTGICIQAYLKRSINDVKTLSGKKAIIRIVKGAHNATGREFYDSREKITLNYLRIMDYLFKHCKRFTIGTHDTRIIERALRLNQKYKRYVTFAMLKGIRSNYAAELARKGEQVAIYVPFGEQWISYAYRRLKELSHLKLFIRSLFGG